MKMTKKTIHGLAAAIAACLLPAAAQAEAKQETAVLAGGCFWGMEAVFEHVRGVKTVVSGYAGGTRSDANYPAVSSEGTRHAEAVRISFDPDQVSYAQLLDVYFSIAHDPTQLNRQGPDTGLSYRSAIFPQSVAQRAIAQQTIASLKTSRAYARPIVTKLEQGAFFPAESEHQDFVRRHPQHPYVVVNDLPKLARLHRTTLWKD